MEMEIIKCTGSQVYPMYTSSILTTTQQLQQPARHTTKGELAYSEDVYYIIEPLQDFNLNTEEPLKIRPFKPKYHMTMALETTTLSDLIPIDNTYLSRCTLRRTLIKTERHEVLACNYKAVPAVLELYTWLTSTYLPMRFPSIYTLTDDELLNNLTRDSLPLHLPASVPSAEHALELLGSNIDDEFLFLLPSSRPPSDGGKYRLEAFINCFPSGFNTRSKLNMLLSDIHGPVPGYAQKYVLFRHTGLDAHA
jgi:hypothetical protein